MKRSSLLASTAGLLIPHHGLGEADTAKLIMTCDHAGCRLVPDDAPRIVVPSRTPEEPGHRPIRIMTTLHYCTPHRAGDFKAADWLNDRNKAQVEQLARQARPADFRPDFEAATVEWVLVASNEYTAYLQKMGVPRAFIG